MHGDPLKETKRLELKDIIGSYLEWAPTSLVIRETCRIRVFNHLIPHLNLSSHPPSRPLKILDIGCGDGRWWKFLKLSEDQRITGIDINGEEISKAKAVIEAYKLDITNSESFSVLQAPYDLIIGNCSLEHIPLIHRALTNIVDLLSPAGHFIMFVPSPDWALRGNTIEFLHRLSPRLSMSFSGLINGFFQHWHLYHHDVWKLLLESHGLAVKQTMGIGDKKSEFLFRLFLVPAFLSFIFKSITGSYVNFMIPMWMKRPLVHHLYQAVRGSLQDKDDANIFEYAIVCHKKRS